MSTIMTDDADRRLATRLRAEREDRGWTIAELAARSGVSRAMVSKVERAEASPTATLLGRLAAAFGLTLSQLFARVDATPGGRVLRRADQPAWHDPATGFRRRSLTPPSTPSGAAPLELVWAELAPGGEVAYEPESYGPIADQQIVVLDGTLTLATDGTPLDVGPGDSYRFGPPAQVRFLNRGPDPCRYLVAVLRRG